MTPTRRLISFVVAAMLVWSVAFGGGYTVALFTANATVSGTFEAADEFSSIDDQAATESASGFGEALDGDINTTKNTTQIGPEVPEIADPLPNDDSAGNHSIGNDSLGGDTTANESVENGSTDSDSDGTVTDPDSAETTDDSDEGDTDDNSDATGDSTDSSDEKSSNEIGSTGDESSDDTGIDDDDNTAESQT